jgi:arginyl-tRNA synthetase
MPEIENLVTTLLKASLEHLKGVFDLEASPEITLEIPKESSFGDLATNLALRLGRQARHPSKELAHIMADYMKGCLKEAPYNAVIRDINVAGAGFINFFIKEEALYYLFTKIRRERDKYGRCAAGKGVKMNIEFASANPTGPLTIAHGRQAAFGDSLANVMEFAGYSVKREYYINDEGRQINLLGASIRARYRAQIGEEGDFPPDGYKGEYITDMAAAIKKRYGAKKKNAPPSFFSDYGYKAIFDGIKKVLKAFGVGFDIWFSQRRLGHSGKVEKAIGLLKEKGIAYENEGALWLRSTDYGDEKDRVIIKSDGAYTYFGPDIAYHIDKYRRGFNKLIDIWGPDHHGYIPRIKAAIEGLGYEKGSLSPLIVQLVTLYRGKTPVPMSTRAGSFVTLAEVVAEIGKDAARFFFLRRRKESHLDFDLELAKEHTPNNPVFYIQYAYARICSIEKKEAAEARRAKADPNLIKSDEELKMLRILRQFPFIIRSSAEGLEPYRLIPYLEDLAKSFHSFYNKHRVVSEDAALTAARMQLVECVKITIANGLRLLGVSAPKQM